ncbi:MAG: indole-3-glycerol phosphate synthase TrpC [Planctomycetota bacterium]|nr:indole-3-glycerol phosphate synthase TrpC [Planctomycetaceae bacterium]MDQ3329172.1 indole-3-glycerol phosphate synthase TrpC [Planctomycetota bacterium]
MRTVLDKIVAQKREDIAAARKRRSENELELAAVTAPPIRDFLAALENTSDIGLIAEIKKASPSAGLIREDFDPVEIATIYETHGATCLSVLTDEQFFQGHLDYLTAVRNAVGLPVLRKDFVLDHYQVLEARAAGADAVLLIAECLDEKALPDLYQHIVSLGMTALVELYEPANLDRVLALDPPLVGVNNRNLKSFVTDLKHTIHLATKMPKDVLLVSESGIRTRADVVRLQSAGCGAILVGETLMRSPDIGRMVSELLGK